MVTAFRAARGLGVTDISYWSLKWLLRNGYAREFLTEDLPVLMLG